jgi:Sec-independent protein secretion pathway component TatC
MSKGRIGIILLLVAMGLVFQIPVAILAVVFGRRS